MLRIGFNVKALKRILLICFMSDELPNIHDTYLRFIHPYSGEMLVQLYDLLHVGCPIDEDGECLELDTELLLNEEGEPIGK